MKKLILTGVFLLIVCIVSAQQFSTRTEMFRPTVHFSEPYKDAIEQVAIDLFLEYAQECYADSTYREVNEFVVSNVEKACPFAGKPEIISGHYQYIYKWVH